MSSSASPAITEAIAVKDQGGTPTNSGPVAIASGIPAVMSDSAAVPGVFGSPEDGDIMVVYRGSKRGRTGRKVSTVWKHLINDIKPNILPFVTCQHCMRTVSTRKKSERAVLHLNSCASFKLSMVDIDDECYPDWFAVSTPKKSAAGRASFVSVLRSIDSRMVPRTQTSITKFTAPRLSKATQLKINSSIAMHYYVNGTSFARIEDPYLLKTFQLCRPDVKLPTLKEQSSSLLNQCYDDIKKKVNSYLASSPYHCITSDGWSNIKNEPIINYMIVSSSVSLCFESIHTGEKSHNTQFLFDDISRIIEKPSSSHVVGAVTDNTSTNKVAWSLSKHRFPGRFFQGCSSHCLLLCAAKDETSVDTMRRMFCCNFLQKSRLWQIWLARRWTPDVATMYEW
jgi:Protein of unknown function (DUF 659)